MGLKDRLLEDLKTSMRQNNVLRKNTIQLIRAAILNEEKRKQDTLIESEVENIIVKERKKRSEALAQFEKAGREDLIQNTKKEMIILDEYLPQPMSEYELTKALEKIIEELQVTTIKDMGKVIRTAKEKYGNKVDGKMVSDITKKLLE